MLLELIFTILSEPTAARIGVWNYEILGIVRNSPNAVHYKQLNKPDSVSVIITYDFIFSHTTKVCFGNLGNFKLG